MESYSALDYLDGLPLPAALSRHDLRIAVVDLEDVGAVSFQPASDNDPQEEDVSKESFEKMGLPHNFSSSKRSYQKTVGMSKKKRKKKHKTGEGMELPKIEETAVELRRRFGRGLFKYWLVRYSLFSKFDDGIRMDKQGWYSVTPECVARYQAQKYQETPMVVLDAFCGVGGNAIQFALHGHTVIAVDNHAERLRMAKHNAEVYDVHHRIDFCTADVFHLLNHMHPDLLFLSPPWGGPHYLNQPHLPFHSPTDLGHYMERIWTWLPSRPGLQIMLYLPRNTDLHSMIQYQLPPLCFREIDIIRVNGGFKAISVSMR